MGNFTCLSPKEAQVITLSVRERMRNTERYMRKDVIKESARRMYIERKMEKGKEGERTKREREKLRELKMHQLYRRKR